jgi:DNA helicase-2/ATP-dependent DNA helicase PcrA
MDQLDNDGLTGSPTLDWRKVRSLLEEADAPQLNKTAEQARFLRLLRRGSAIEQKLIGLWTGQGDYRGAEAALELAMLQEQLTDAHRETATVTVMNLHQLKGREYDAVVLVEDKYNTFRAKDQSPHYADTRRLLQVSLTRARHYVILLTQSGASTLESLTS